MIASSGRGYRNLFVLICVVDNMNTTSISNLYRQNTHHTNALENCFLVGAETGLLWHINLRRVTFVYAMEYLLNEAKTFYI